MEKRNLRKSLATLLLAGSMLSGCASQERTEDTISEDSTQVSILVNPNGRSQWDEIDKILAKRKTEPRETIYAEFEEINIKLPEGYVLDKEFQQRTGLPLYTKNSTREEIRKLEERVNLGAKENYINPPRAIFLHDQDDFNYVAEAVKSKGDAFSINVTSESIGTSAEPLGSTSRTTIHLEKSNPIPFNHEYGHHLFYRLENKRQEFLTKWEESNRHNKDSEFLINPTDTEIAEYFALSNKQTKTEEEIKRLEMLTEVTREINVKPGEVSAYGGKHLEEGISETFREITTKPKSYYRRIESGDPAYRERAKLLLEYKFITRDQYRAATKTSK